MGCKLAKTIFANLSMGERLPSAMRAYTSTHRHKIGENELVKESELILVWMIWSINTFWGGQQRWCGFPYIQPSYYLALLYLLHTHAHGPTHSAGHVFFRILCECVLSTGSSNKKRMGFECVRLIFYSLHLVGISLESMYTPVRMYG